MHIQDKIIPYLKNLEHERKIKILLACETGSRAWGFPSIDSDFDIRIIYVHKKDWYLTLNEPKDSIEIMLENNEIDISGWELKKSLNLLRKSNAPLLERIQSPLIYLKDDQFTLDIVTVAKTQYSPIATIHHYLSMAKKFIEELSAEQEYKLKKFFYALRAATVCKWILEKEEIPPIEFHKIYPYLSIKPKLVKRIDELVILKSKISETYLHSNDSELLDFIQQCITDAEQLKNTLPSSKGGLSELNLLLRKYIDKFDN